MNAAQITEAQKLAREWVAQFAVASELCKRGYEVAFTMAPLADLMVVSPMSKKNFLIDVKGLYKPNPNRRALELILAWVSPRSATSSGAITTECRFLERTRCRHALARHSASTPERQIGSGSCYEILLQPSSAGSAIPSTLFTGRS